MPEICLSLAEPDLDFLNLRIAEAVGRVPLIEVRLDFLTPVQVPLVPKNTGTRFIATCRPGREGGCYVGEESHRLAILERAALQGFQGVDLEHDVAVMPSFPPGTAVIRSLHRFDRMPANLDVCIEKLMGIPGDVIKLAIPVRTTGELVELLKWRETRELAKPSIVIGMESAGQPSRLLGAFLGNLWTYVAEHSQTPAAPGQFGLEEALDLYRLGEWDTVPEFFGVLGQPVAHSLSPMIHNRLFRHYRQERLYLPILLDDVDLWLGYALKSRLRFGGFSVTLPFKSEVLRHIRELDSTADAVNTLIQVPGGWRGLNTDYAGFLAPLQRRIELAGRRALVLGTGGAARTVVRALLDQGCTVTVAGRNAVKRSWFEERFGCATIAWGDGPVAADLCVNTTPVGQFPNVDRSPLDEEQLEFEWVYDLIYNPEETRLLEMARRRGLQVLSGMEMFVEQAALQFQAWTQIDPDRELMSCIVKEALVS